MVPRSRGQNLPPPFWGEGWRHLAVFGLGLGSGLGFTVGFGLGLGSGSGLGSGIGLGLASCLSARPFRSAARAAKLV